MRGIATGDTGAGATCSSQSPEVSDSNSGPWANRDAITGWTMGATPSSRPACLVRKSLISPLPP
ncbi:MAG TPA: hypothetical protein VFA32_21905, partial [Dehalococcoidia bacterium]|nr:hypothetical protein [Dehalococcoidia bacterium]